MSGRGTGGGRAGGGGRVGLLVFLLIGAVIALGLYGGDRYLASRAERETATQLQDQLGTPVPPQVDIRGWPFVTQALAQHLDSVRVVADDLRAGTGGSTVPVAHLDLVLTDVRSADRFQTMTAGHVEGTARLAYADLRSLSSVPLTYAGNGRLRAEVSSAVFGLDVQAKVTGTPRLDVEGQVITLADPKLELANVDLPNATADALLRVLLKPIPVTGLPFGLTLTSISAEDDGLHVGVVGNDVEFSR